MQGKEQRECIRFSVLLYKSPAETLRMTEEAYGKAVMNKTQVHEWHKRFHDGRASVSDYPRCGQPSASTNDENIERVQDCENDGLKGIQEISA
jgi:hypothetical protein